MIIRTYQSTDQDQVIELWQLTGVASLKNNPARDIARKQKVDPDLFLVAVDKDVVVASIMGGYEGHRGWVNYLAVHPSVQRQGIARQMMSEVETLLIKKGCPKINLQVRNSNSKALSFYKALGYLDDNVIGLGKRLEHE